MPDTPAALLSKLPAAHAKRIAWALKDCGHLLVEAVRQDSSAEARHVERPSEDQVPERVAQLILERADPTSAKSMTGWLVRQYAQGKLRLEDTGTAYETLDMFHRYAPKLPEGKRDLGKYSSLAEAWDVVFSLAEAAQDKLSGKAEKAMERDKAYAESRILRQDEDGFTIAVPLTEFAAKWWGRGTRWCTAAEKDNQFWYYHQQAPLIVLVIPELKERGKFQIWATNSKFQLMDATDTAVSQDVISEHWPRFEQMIHWAASENIEALQYIPGASRTYEMCEKWVEKDGQRLHLIPSEFQTSDICKIALLSNGVALRDMPKHLITSEFCEVAVQNLGLALQYVPRELQNSVLCKIAVQQDGRALEFVPPGLRTGEICEIAVRQNASASSHVPLWLKNFQFHEKAVTHGSQVGEPLRHLPLSSNSRWKRKMCNIAVRRNPGALEHVREEFRGERIYATALRGSGLALAYVPFSDRTQALCKMAVSQNGEALEHVPEPFRTKEICEIAVRNSGAALPHVPEALRTSGMCEWAIVAEPTFLRFVPGKFRTKAMCELAVGKNGLALHYVPFAQKTDDLCKVAVRQQGLALAYVPKHLCSAAICEAAVRQDVRSLMYVPECLRAALEFQVQLSLNAWGPSLLDRIECFMAGRPPRDLASSICP
jgi:hypothetical protein